jgi:hypothetical protein
MIASTITLVVGATSCSFTFDPAAAHRNWTTTAAQGDGRRGGFRREKNWRDE